MKSASLHHTVNAGTGKQAIARLKAICRDANVMKMWVPTARSNIAATRLYATTGALPLSNETK